MGPPVVGLGLLASTGTHMHTQTSVGVDGQPCGGAISGYACLLLGAGLANLSNQAQPNTLLPLGLHQMFAVVLLITVNAGRIGLGCCRSPWSPSLSYMMCAWEISMFCCIAATMCKGILM